MNKLILIIFFTFVSSTSFSKEITLNCKFLNGQMETKSGIISKEISDEFKQDLLIKFDESNRFVTFDSIFFFNSSEVSFSQDLIRGERNYGNMIETFKLNRLTGVLYRELNFIRYESIYTLNYKCSQIDKKLF